MRDSLPHMRGGVSFFMAVTVSMRASSPHAWGCFYFRDAVESITIVFPTCVGVFPELTQALKEIGGLPHMRGGVSSSR